VQRTTLYGRTRTEGRRLRPPAEVLAGDAAADAFLAVHPSAPASPDVSVPVTLSPTRD
jgi:hypothetical protein